MSRSTVKPSILVASIGAFALALAGCDKPPTFTPATNAPPGTVADYFEDEKSDVRSIIITEGLAFALECSDGHDRPCTFDGSTVADTEIASVRRAYGDLEQKLVYGSSPGVHSNQTRTLFVVVAKKAGTTTLSVKTGTGTTNITIEVLKAK